MTLEMSKLIAFRAGLPQAIDDGVHDTAIQVIEVRNEYVPVDTGDLLNSGEINQIDSGVWEVSEGNGLPDARAAFTEFGTDKAPAQPHMTPAAEQNRANLATNIAARIKALA